MRRPTFGIMWLPVIIGIVGTAATVATTASLWRLSEIRTRHRFEQAADHAASLIGDRLRAYIALLHGGAGLFSGSEDVTPTEFSRFSARMRVYEDYPGAQGIGFARLLRTPEEAQRFRAAMRRRHGEDFRFVPEAPDRPERVVVEYLEPGDVRNTATIGWDMESEPVRRAALDRARDIGLAVGTGPLTLRQEPARDPRSDSSSSSPSTPGATSRTPWPTAGPPSPATSSAPSA